VTIAGLRVSIFGASGATGQRLTLACLRAGYNVTALLRHPETFALRQAVTVVPGDARDLNAVRRAIIGADVVLSALGARSPFADDDTLQLAIPLIIAAMKEAGVRRIIALGSAGARPGALSHQSHLRRWIATGMQRILLRHPVAAQQSQWQALSTSGLDFTMPMPPMLTNRPGRGQYRTDPDALPRNATQISRDDVADFMMQQIEGVDWIGKSVYIAW
jgi:putative NADH-flavin reductase